MTGLLRTDSLRTRVGLVDLLAFGLNESNRRKTKKDTINHEYRIRRLLYKMMLSDRMLSRDGLVDVLVSGLIDSNRRKKATKKSKTTKKEKDRNALL